MDKIGEFTNSTILSFNHVSSLQEAAQYMEANDIGSLLVKKFDDYNRYY